MAHQSAGVLEGKSLDVDDVRGQSGGLHGRLALLDVLGARRHQEHVQHVGILLRGADDLIVVADLFHREGNVLVGLHLDLALEFVFAEGLRHLDDFGDRGVAADRDGRQAALRSGALHRAPDRLTHGFRIDDGLLVDGIVRRRLRGI